MAAHTVVNATDKATGSGTATTNATGNGNATAKAQLAALESARVALEKELQVLMADEKRLSKGHTTLTDAQGYPIAEVDVHAVRIARNALARKRNDYSALNRQITDLIFAHFQNPNPTPKTEWTPPPLAATTTPGSATASSTTASSTTGSSTSLSGDYKSPPKPTASANAATPANTATSVTSASGDSKDSKADTSSAAAAANAHSQANAKTHAQAKAKAEAEAELARINAFTVDDAFYVVNRVWENSPATAAGLKTGDRVLSFGTINRVNNATDKGALPALVSSSEGKPLAVVVHRNGEGNKQLTLVPQKWAGKGLLGCHILPL